MRYSSFIRLFRGAARCAASIWLLSSFPAFAQTPIKIGIIFPLGGQQGEYVKRYLVAPLEFAVKEVNDSGGVLGHQIKLVVEDTRPDPASAVSALRKLADVDRVLAVYTGFTPLTLPQLPIVEEKHIILFAPAVEHPDLTKSAWAVRMTWTAEQTGALIARVATNLAVKTSAVFTEDNDSSRVSARVFQAEFEKSGGKVVATESAKTQDTDLRGQLTKLRAAQPDALYLLFTSGRPMALALRQAAEVGLRPKHIFANHVIEDREIKAIGGNISEGAIYATLEVNPDFSKRFNASQGYAPDANAGKHYDALMLLVEAMKRANTADDPVKIRDAIYGFGEFKGVVGTFRFHGNGEPDVVPTMKTIKDGEPTDFKSAP